MEFKIHVPFDEVTIVLSARRDIVSETVRVDAAVAVSLAGDEGGRFRDIVRQALKTAIDSEWAFKSITRKEEDSGMEQMLIIASTRVPEHRTTGLVDRLRAASRPGLKLDLAHIQYRPPQADIKKVVAELRAEIYQLAGAEAQRLNDRLPADSIPWRVARVEMSAEDIGGIKERLRRINRGHPRLVLGKTQEFFQEHVADFQSMLRVEIEAEVLLRRLALPLAPAQFFKSSDSSDG